MSLEYERFFREDLGLLVVRGEKSTGERFSGALRSYSIECLLPDGRCLQLATSHYFGSSFCELMGVNFRKANDDKKKSEKSPGFSTS